MRIYLNKFGNILISRQSGKEAYAAFSPTLKTIQTDENVEVDFDGVITFSPSWGDEFLTPLIKQFGKRLRLFNIDKNPSIIESLKIIEQVSGFHFEVK